MLPKLILIVDDDETSRKIIALALKRDERLLIFAKDGDEAVQKATEHHPDLIIMDIMLPKLNGYQAAKIIKGNSDLKHIPVVAITARTADYDKDMALEAGCDEYITKPFRINDLREKLAKYL